MVNVPVVHTCGFSNEVEGRTSNKQLEHWAVGEQALG
jgi:hypothetical protein